MAKESAQVPETCYRCVNYSVTGDGRTFCHLFGDPIYDEALEAQLCGAFDPVDGE